MVPHSMYCSWLLVRPVEALVEAPVGAVERVGMKANFHEPIPRDRSSRLKESLSSGSVLYYNIMGAST